jgi:hypothetical protein
MIMDAKRIASIDNMGFGSDFPEKCAILVDPLVTQPSLPSSMNRPFSGSKNAAKYNDLGIFLLPI